MNLDEQKKQIQDLNKKISRIEDVAELGRINSEIHLLKRKKSELLGRLEVVGSDAHDDYKNYYRFISEMSELPNLEYLKAKLIQMKEEYYYSFFDQYSGDNYEWLTSIPKNVNPSSHVLDDYSCLNIDAVANSICKLYRDIEHKRLVCSRLNFDNSYYLIITNREKAKQIDDKRQEESDDMYYKIMHDDDSLMLPYSGYIDPDSHFIYDEKDLEFVKKYYNDDGYNAYSSLINNDRLVFNSKAREFTRELVFNLANYQRINGIDYMSYEDTTKVFDKIYKKR